MTLFIYLAEVKKINYFFYNEKISKKFILFYFFTEGEIIFKRFDSNQKKVIQNILEEDLEKEIHEKNIMCHNPDKQKIMRMFNNKRSNNFKPNNINFFKCKKIFFF